MGKAPHPGVSALLGWLEPNPNLPEHLRDIAWHVSDLAGEMVSVIDDDAELTAGLRKLLEAKDCFVRARLVGER